MELGVTVHLKDQPGKKAVLVKHVVGDVFSKIDKNFIIDKKLQTARLKTFYCNRQKQGKVVADAPVEIVAVGQFAVAQYFPAKTLLQPSPLHKPCLSPAHEPLHLLPGAVFGLRNVLVTFGGEMMDVCVGRRQPDVVGEVEGWPHTDDKLRRLAHEIVFQPKMRIKPQAPPVRQAGLVEKSEPGLLLG
ncbi:MAG: hypothetical protein OHK0019_12210 [Saprospiraceae bacterium]